MQRLDGRFPEDFRHPCTPVVYYSIFYAILIPLFTEYPFPCVEITCCVPFVAGLQVGVLSQAQGSSYIEVGATKVMAGVFGPRESDMYRDSFTPQGRIAVDVSIVTIPSRPKVGPRKV